MRQADRSAGIPAPVRNGSPPGCEWSLLLMAGGTSRREAEREHEYDFPNHEQSDRAGGLEVVVFGASRAAPVARV